MACIELAALIPGYHTGRLQAWVNLFSTGTALSNLLTAVIYIIYAFLVFQEVPRWLTWVRGAAVFYMLATLLAYAVLMQTGSYYNAVSGFAWKNFVLHLGGPLFLLCWWILWRPPAPVRYAMALLWLAPALLYISYSLLWGARTGYYPYTFLNPAITGGNDIVSVYLLVCGAGFVLLALLVAWMSREQK